MVGSPAQPAHCWCVGMSGGACDVSTARQRERKRPEQMPRTGRNDPCPCGSGIKYKNCCLSRDRGRRIGKGARRRDEQATTDKLVAFAQRSGLHRQMIVASNLFWNGSYGPEALEALDRQEVTRFLEWYVHDYRLEQSRKRAIDLFLEESGPSLLPLEREQVLQWRESYLSLYRVLGSREEGFLSVVDTLQGGEQDLQDDGLGRISRSGDLILGRILRSSDPAHFSWGAILLPAALEAELVSLAQGACRDYREAHVRATWPDFLSNNGYMFNHSFLRSAAEAGTVRRFAGAYYDASGTVQKLQEVEKRLREHAARRVVERQRAEQPTAEASDTHRQQTQGGVFLPGHVQYGGASKPRR